ncbi:MAG: hypothetical protein AB1716_16110 [Planctomycetota bacterium]
MVVWLAPAALVVAVAGVGALWWARPTLVVDEMRFPSPADVPPAAWSQLAGRRVFFGHQSVGDDIVAGLEDVLRARPDLGLRICRTAAPVDFAGPVFAHDHLGVNGDPCSKLRAFADVLDGGLGRCVDVAFFKFCYVDVTAATDVPALFAEYRATLDRLERDWPAVTFVHVTVPLTVRPAGLKAEVQRLLGRANDNLARCRFNALLRAEYAGRAPLFDLAAVEATGPDGFCCGYDDAGVRVTSLASVYTGDGGHLNAVGRRRAAERLLVVLAGPAGELAGLVRKSTLDAGANP